MLLAFLLISRPLLGDPHRPDAALARSKQRPPLERGLPAKAPVQAMSRLTERNVAQWL